MQPPLSFIRNPSLPDRYSHFHSQKEGTEVTPVAAKKVRRDQNEGKRWIRRKDNAHFVGNPHVVVPTKRDYILQSAHIQSTFSEPLPPYISRRAKLPTTIRPTLDPNSANAGRFSLSLKGMRRELRKSGFRAQLLVRSVEHEIIEWLQAGGTILAPDAQDGENDLPGIPLGETGPITEVSRTPLWLVWFIPCDAFARYVVHCCARYHEIVSFSKEVNGRRLTYLLRPNVIRPDYRAQGNLDTPPITDYSHPNTESDRDFASDIDADSDAEHVHPSPIPEDLSVHSLLLAPFAHTLQIDNGAWSIVQDTDAEGDESGSEAGLTASVTSTLPGPPLSDVGGVGPAVDASMETDRTPRGGPPKQQTLFNSRQFWDRHHRSTSSPSCSPARILHRHESVPLSFGSRHSRGLPTPRHCHSSFYDYLFS